MSARRVEITVSEETWQEIEAARGDMPRAAWIKRALRAALDQEAGAGNRIDAQALVAELKRLIARATDIDTDTV